MGIDLKKTSHILFFVVFLPALSFGIGWAFAFLLPNLPFWVETISPLAAYGILYGLFDKYFWHWPFFRWIGVVIAPDVRGRWLGEQSSSFKGEDGKNRTSRVIMEIDQSFAAVKVATYYKHWQTTQTISSFMRVSDECTLFVLFETEPKLSYDGEAVAHKGVMRLTQQPNTQLVGTYFNAQGNHGELSFKRTRYTLHHTFEPIRTKK